MRATLQSAIHELHARIRRSRTWVAVLACLLFVLYEPLVEYVSDSPHLRRGAGAPPARSTTTTTSTAPSRARPAPAHQRVAARPSTTRPARRRARAPPDAYVAHVLSRAPLVLYVEGFLSEAERAHLFDVSEPLFEPSTVTSDGAATRREAAVRDSEVALVPRTAPVRCLERRAAALQGWRADLWVERLRTQRYRGPAGHYAHHFDWGSGARGLGGGGFSSVRQLRWMVTGLFSEIDSGQGKLTLVMPAVAWVHADEDLEGGGTELPLLRWRADRKRWCERWLECPPLPPPEDGDGEDERFEDYVGATFRAVPGNAVFWENFRPDGTGVGWEESWHAGLPVKRGVKVGLNIWSWGRL
ncbi:hypothetical protein DL771_000160 [Monosporascus sp. 5C6A]|nr:hypothetical protein DL771_000160 [Monosporascus sp. 5C6A]